jgi:phosphoribosylglycinamide formyltransferase-1
MIRVAALISGGGTTFMAIYNAIQAGELTGVEIACLISSKHEAGGILKAREAGFPSQRIFVLRRQDFASSLSFGEAILAACEATEANFLGQYGWMPWTPGNVVEHFKGRSTNQHPGPIWRMGYDFGGQDMFGKRVHAARLYFVRLVRRECMWTEAISQYLAPDYDEGAVIRREVVPIEKGDDVESLQARVLPAEHRVQIQTLRDFAQGTVSFVQREEPVVYPDEVGILNEAKRIAKILYPKG